jgi:hypothetical protein
MLVDSVVAARGPFAIVPGPTVSQVFSPADRQHLLDRSLILLNQRSPKVVSVESKHAAIDRQFGVILELDIVRPPDDKAGHVMVWLVLRVWDTNGTLHSFFEEQLFGVDARRASQRKVIDDALPLIDSRAAMLLRPFRQ